MYILFSSKALIEEWFCWGIFLENILFFTIYSLSITNVILNQLLIILWKWKSLSQVRLFETPWTMELSRPNTGVGSLSLLQWIFLNQGSNPGLLNCRQILYQLIPQEKSKNTRVGSLSLLPGFFLTHESNWGLLYCGRILYQLSYQGRPIISRVLY